FEEPADKPLRLPRESLGLVLQAVHESRHDHSGAFHRELFDLKVLAAHQEHSPIRLEQYLVPVEALYVDDAFYRKVLAVLQREVVPPAGTAPRGIVHLLQTCSLD